jgi:hypothetical protein
MPVPVRVRWTECLYWPERLQQDCALVAKAANRLSGQAERTVRLAKSSDAGSIERLEREGFKQYRRVNSSPTRLYDPDWFCENRLGPLLRIVCEDQTGISAFGIAQIRLDEVYLYEIVGSAGSNAPGHAIFHTFAQIAADLGKDALTAMLSRTDTRRAMLRLSQRLGMHPAPHRGFTLDGAIQKPEWIWLSGDPTEICVTA